MYAPIIAASAKVSKAELSEDAYQDAPAEADGVRPIADQMDDSLTLDADPSERDRNTVEEPGSAWRLV